MKIVNWMRRKSKKLKLFRENLSNTQYAESQDKISDLTDCGVEMRSSYLIYKDASKKVEGYKINNAEYDGADT